MFNWDRFENKRILKGVKENLMKQEFFPVRVAKKPNSNDTLVSFTVMIPMKVSLSIPNEEGWHGDNMLTQSHVETIQRQAVEKVICSDHEVLAKAISSLSKEQILDLILQATDENLIDRLKEVYKSKENEK